MRKMLRLAILFFLLNTIQHDVHAQSDTSFWFAAPDLNGTISSGPGADRPIFLRVSASSASANIIISQPANPLFIPIVASISANTSQSFDLTSLITDIENDQVNTVMNKGLLIRSTEKISCYYDVVNTRSGDIFALKGKNALGNNFVVPFDMLFANRTNATEATTNTNDFVLVATEDNTQITITPKNDLVGHVAAQAFTVSLNKGQTYMCRAATNTPFMRPGGTIVKASKPISMSIKEDLLQYPGAGCADSGGDQLISDDLAGKEFIVVKGRFTSGNPDYYYVFATTNGVTVKLNGAQVATLNIGEYYTGMLYDESCYIETSGPSHLLHMSGFGCEIGAAVIPSIKCTGSQRVNLTRASSTEEFYLNVLAPKDIINTFLVNGNPAILGASNFVAVVGNSDWMQARISIPSSFAAGGSNVTIENAGGKFHVGVIQGNTSSTTRYGYFSDFSTNSVQLKNPNDPINDLSSSVIVCNNTTYSIKAVNKEATSFSWTGPNGFTSNSDELIIDPFKSINVGTYTVTTFGIGCGNATKDIVLNIDKPNADFTVTGNGCNSSPVNITTPAGAGVHWNWSFGNSFAISTNSNLITPQIIPETGNVVIKLNVRSVLGCYSDTTIKTIALSSKPIAAYTIPSIRCVNDAINFTDASTIVSGNIVKWRWDLDNGNGFDEKTTNAIQSATYGSYGSKIVKLVVESNSGCISDTFRLVSFNVNPYPIAGFINPEVCQNDNASQFIDTTKSPDGYTGFTYLWDFNAGTTPVANGPTVSFSSTTVKNPIVQYHEANKYVVKLTVNSRGCISTINQNFKVNGANPIPAFNIVNPTSLCSNDSIRIVNNSTIDFDNVTRLEIFWDQNDPSLKTVDEEPYIGKVYAFKYNNFLSPANRTINISLQAFSGSALSCSKTLTQSVVLNATPKANFNLMPGICVDATARQITEATFDPLVPCSVTFSGLGVNASGLFNPPAAGAGSHTIKYLVKSNLSVCKDSATSSIVVWPSPTADFSFTNIDCEKNAITFTSSSNANAGTIAKWIWSFNDGTNTQVLTNENPLPHIFSNYGNYNVNLVVETNNGCRSLQKQSPLVIHPLPIIDFGLPVVCLPEGKATFSNSTNIPDASVGLMTYLWDFGDANNKSSSVLKDGVHNFYSKGSYTVKLIATSNNGCLDSTMKSFSGILDQPKAGFSSEDSLCIGDLMHFKDTSKSKDGIITKWFWDLGDKTIDNTQQLTHLYNSPGIYSISLYTQSDLGCYSDTVKKQMEIFAYPKVSAGPDLAVLDDGQKNIQSSVTGRVIKYNWTPSTFLSATNILRPVIIKPKENMYYYLEVTGRGGCISRDTVYIISLTLPKPPNTFTPNGDGVNDTWEIKYLDQYPDCIVEIYTTTGQRIFSNKGYSKPWDGTLDGIQVPSGTYYFAIDPKNGRKPMAGYITIIR